MKKWIIRIVMVILLLLVSTVIAIELNKEKIAKAAATEINNQISGSFDYEEVDVSLLSSFPYLGVRFKGIDLRDADQREEKAIYEDGQMLLQINLLSLIRNRDQIKVYRFGLKGGEIYAANYKDGKNNYTLFKETDSSTTQSTAGLKVEEFFLDNVAIIYRDDLRGLIARLTPLNLNGSLSLNDAEVTFNNKFDTHVLLDYNRILPNYGFDLAGEVKIKSSLAYDHFEIDKADLLINQLPFFIMGSADLMSDNYSYNIKANAPETSITKLIGLLPGSYNSDLGHLTGEGTFKFDLSLVGKSSEAYPLYELSIETNGKNIKNNKLPKSIDRLAFNLEAKNTNVKTSNSTFSLSNFNLLIDKSTIQGELFSTPIGQGYGLKSDIIIDFDLNDWQESIAQATDQKLAGKLKGRIKSNIETDANNQISLGGQSPLQIELNIDDVLIGQTSDGTIEIKHIDLTGDDKLIKFKGDQINYLEAVIMNLDGEVTDPLSFYLGSDATLRAKVNIDATKMNLESLPQSEVTRQYDIPNIEIDANFSANTIQQNGYLLSNTTASGLLNNNESKIRFNVGEMMGNSFTGEGTLLNILGYSLNNDTLRGNLIITSQKFSLDPFITEDESTPTNEESLIPGNINLAVDYQAEQLKFKNFDFSKAIGQVVVRDQKVEILNGGNILGGNIQMSMGFDASRADSFLIDLNIKLEDLGFSQTAQQSKLFNQLIPIASFIDGRYNSTFSWKSKLNKSYIPDLNSLTAYGDIRTKGASISSLLPLKEVMDRFVTTSNETGTIILEDVNRYFAIQEGRVILEKAEFNKEGIDFLVSGSHSFAQDIDYKLIMDIPQEMLKLEQLMSEAKGVLKINQDWLKLAPKTMIQLEIKVNGNIKKPLFKLVDVRIKTGNIAKSIAEEIELTYTKEKEKLEKTVKDTIQKTKDKIEDKILTTKDSLMQVADSTMAVVKGAIDSTKLRAEQEIKSEKDQIKKEAEAVIDSLKAGNIDSITTKVEDIFKGRVDKIEEIKDKIKIKWPKKNGND